MRLIRRLTASDVNGPPRSVANTKPVSGNCRRSSRKARSSSPRSGCTDGLPLLTRRTCSEADRPNSRRSIQMKCVSNAFLQLIRKQQFPYQLLQSSLSGDMIVGLKTLHLAATGNPDNRFDQIVVGCPETGCTGAVIHLEYTAYVPAFCTGAT